MSLKKTTKKNFFRLTNLDHGGRSDYQAGDDSSITILDNFVMFEAPFIICQLRRGVMTKRLLTG